MRTQGDSQQDVLWLIDGKHDAGHWVMIAARTAEYLRTLAGGREVQVGQLAEFAVHAMLDKMSIRHRIVRRSWIITTPSIFATAPSSTGSAHVFGRAILDRKA